MATGDHLGEEIALEARAAALISSRRDRRLALPQRFAGQVTHLTCPATVWKYVVGAVTRSDASLVMLDLEDSIPRGDDQALARGRDNIVRAFETLDWGSRLRFFRPRGLELDPGFSDLTNVVLRAGDRIEGLIYPKVESAEEVRLLDDALSAVEKARGLESGHIRIGLLIESVEAEAHIDEIACASERLCCLILGVFDYWGSLSMAPSLCRADHPLLLDLRARLVKAAARVGVPAIAEMTANYPTKDKFPEEQRAALEECRRDARLARDMGFEGKWVGMPAQCAVVAESFALDPGEVARAVDEVRAFLEAERSGRGAVMIDGKMADRATDWVNRRLLIRAKALGQLDSETASELGLS